MRSETFADHYSQARQFYVSQTPVEQQHIIDAFVFELSKVERLDIRARMVANLMNVDDDLATSVADGLGLEGAVDPSVPARTPITDLRRHRRSASCRTVPTVSRGGSWECSSPTRAMRVCSANCSRPP